MPSRVPRLDGKPAINMAVQLTIVANAMATTPSWSGQNGRDGALYTEIVRGGHKALRHPQVR